MLTQLFVFLLTPVTDQLEAQVHGTKHLIIKQIAIYLLTNYFLSLSGIAYQLLRAACRKELIA
jgi:hypothetical protein